MLTRSKFNTLCCRHGKYIVMLVFFPSIVMFRSINKTMDNNKTLNTCFEELKHFPLHNKSNRKLFYHKTLLY